MKDAEYLREVYNKRFRESVNKWGSEDIDKCLKTTRKVIAWTKIKIKESPKMLDVGCATGFFTRAFSICGFDAYGLDYSDVAVAKASELHPKCHFVHMDGFKPVIDIKFDLIFCRGFSGSNSHNLIEVAEWVNKYIDLLNPGGKFIYSYSSDFTGVEGKEETVNWTHKEIDAFKTMINADFSDIFYYHRFGLLSKAYLFLKNIFLKKKLKEYYYLIFTSDR